MRTNRVANIVGSQMSRNSPVSLVEVQLLSKFDSIVFDGFKGAHQRVDGIRSPPEGRARIQHRSRF